MSEMLQRKPEEHQVFFMFKLKQKVTTIFGRTGVIAYRSYDPDEIPGKMIQYFIKTQEGKSDTWVHQDDIINVIHY